jgi:hypothetical protein
LQYRNWSARSSHFAILFDSKPENQQACRMKTTIDLPADLVREMKLRAVHEGRKLKDVAAELLKRGLGQPVPTSRQPRKPIIDHHPLTGLPVVRCAADAPASRMTTRELLAIEQETLEQEDLQRAGLSL